MTPAIATVAREVTALGGPLVARDAPVAATAPIVTTARTLRGALYIFAVNPPDKPTHAKVTAPGLNGRTVGILGEHRTLDGAGDAFEDDFAPLGVHLYVIPPAG